MCGCFRIPQNGGFRRTRGPAPAGAARTGFCGPRPAFPGRRACRSRPAPPCRRPKDGRRPKRALRKARSAASGTRRGKAGRGRTFRPEARIGGSGRRTASGTATERPIAEIRGPYTRHTVRRSGEFKCQVSAHPHKNVTKENDCNTKCSLRCSRTVPSIYRSRIEELWDPRGLAGAIITSTRVLAR